MPWGANLQQVSDAIVAGAFEVLEATAEALILARPLGEIVPMPEAVLDELRRAFGVA